MASTCSLANEPNLSGVSPNPLTAALAPGLPALSLSTRSNKCDLCATLLNSPSHCHHPHVQDSSTHHCKPCELVVDSQLRLIIAQFTALRAPVRVPAVALASPSLSFARRYLSQDVRAKIQEAVKSTPVVLFMKGTPDAPQCGFSRAAVQVLDINGVPAEKMKTFDVLEDSELRQSIKEFSYVSLSRMCVPTRIPLTLLS